MIKPNPSRKRQHIMGDIAPAKVPSANSHRRCPYNKLRDTSSNSPKPPPSSTKSNTPANSSRPQLYDNLAAASAELRTFLTEFRKNPKILNRQNSFSDVAATFKWSALFSCRAPSECEFAPRTILRRPLVYTFSLLLCDLCALPQRSCVKSASSLSFNSTRFCLPAPYVVITRNNDRLR